MLNIKLKPNVEQVEVRPLTFSNELDIFSKFNCHVIRLS
jgi:hypothetical protein